MSSIQAFLEAHVFAEVAVIFVIIAFVSYVMKLLRQPMIIGYIIVGVIVGPAFLWWMHHTEAVKLFSHIWVAILLFMVGLGLNPSIVKDLGKASLVVGIGQVVFTTGIGVLIALALGFTSIESIYIAVALAFSSTIIIVKLLSDKWVMDELFGKISIGMLIVQDLIAMLILMILSSLPAAGVEVNRLWFTGALLLKILAVGVLTVVVAKYVIPKFLKYAAKSSEFLFVFSIAWCMLFASGMQAIGFSLEIGALLAGVALASSPYRFEISSKMKPLRDFFLMMFFVFLGSELQFGDITAYIPAIIIFSLFVLLGNPLIVMVLMGRLGYQKKNGMMVGFTVAQISEFSFILIALAASIWHIVNESIIVIVTIVGLCTIAGSSYYFTFAEDIYHKLKKYLSIFERHVTTEAMTNTTGEEVYDIVVFGNHRTWKGIVDMLIAHEKKFIIIDYDPHVIKKLIAEGIPCRYGDASDIELLEELQLHKAKMVVSTIHDYDTNALILHQTKKLASHLVTILSASKVEAAESLYAQGASYVLIPYIVGGHHTAMLIEQFEYDIEKYTAQKISDYELLK